MKSDFLIAFTQLAAERNLPKETVLAAIESALASAYKKDSMASGHNLAVRLNPGTGDIHVYAVKEVVEELTDSKKELTVEEAQEFKKGAVLGDVIEIEATPQTAGRIAAQTAKQAVIQRLREAERELVYDEYADKEGDVLSATVVRSEPRQIVLDLGRTEAILPYTEQVPSERYRPGLKLKVYLVEVRRSSKGPEIVLSRTHKGLLKRLFELEVPEIFNGAVEIMSIARDPGSRSKVAVRAKQENIDAVGSCVGLRGIRIQNIVNELHGEKIDVVQWSKDTSAFLANALSPSQVIRVELNEEDNQATVIVPDRQLSLAIGKEGQNARLAAKLTGWKVDIKSASGAEEGVIARVDGETQAGAVAVAEAPKTEAVAVEVPEPEEAAETIEAPAAEVEVISEEVLDEEAVAEEETEEVTLEETQNEEAVGTLSAEEELANASLQEDLVQTAVRVPEAKSIEEIPEDVWRVARVAPGPGMIRFSEDIMGPRAPRGRRGRRGDSDEVSGKGNKGTGKRARVPRTGEEEPEDAAAK